MGRSIGELLRLCVYASIALHAKSLWVAAFDVREMVCETAFKLLTQAARGPHPIAGRCGCRPQRSGADCRPSRRFTTSVGGRFAIAADLQVLLGHDRPVGRFLGLHRNTL